MPSVSYINCKNEKIDFIKPRFVVTDASEIFSNSWKYDTNYSRITHFKRDIFLFKFSVATDLLNANKLIEITEKDVRMDEYGTLLCNGWYLPCWCISVTTKKYFKHSDLVELQLEIVTDQKAWNRETKFVYREGRETKEGVNYPYDYPYDFASEAMLFELNNKSFTECDFRMTIYGYAQNPKVSIGTQEYSVNTRVDVNEYLVIDSNFCTVKRTDKRGVVINEYPNINLDSYIFQKIQPGNYAINTNADFSLDIVIIEERSEPEWI